MKYESIKSNTKFIFLDILIGYMDLLYILFGVVSFFFFMYDQQKIADKNLFASHPKSNDFLYFADIFKSAAIIITILLLVVIAKSIKQRNIRYTFYDNYIEQYDIKTKTKKIKQFNHIEIYKNMFFITAEFNSLTGNEPKDCFKIYASHRKEKEFLEGIFKSVGFTGNIEEYSIQNQKTNSHNIGSLIKLLIYLSITAAVAFFPALHNLKFIWISVFLILIIAPPFIISEMKAFLNKDIIYSSITNNGLKIQKGNHTNYLFFSAINICDVIEGKNTDDILVHISRWKSGKQIATKEFLLEGVPKSESNRINKFLEKQSRY